MDPGYLLYDSVRYHAEVATPSACWTLVTSMCAWQVQPSVFVNKHSWDRAGFRQYCCHAVSLASSQRKRCMMAPLSIGQANG